MSETVVHGVHAFLRKRRIDVIFNIIHGGVNGDINETITLSEHRVSCQILCAGMETGVMCAVRIEGMKPDQMNRLSVVQAGVVAQSMNTVTVMAGSEGGVMSTVFSGGIIEGFVDYTGAPNVAFEVRAMSTTSSAAMAVTATSFNASVSVALAMQEIAKKVGLEFQNYGVETVLPAGVYYSGSALDQMSACASAAGIYFIISMNILSIWPKDFVPDEDGAINISSGRGMIGYPSYSQGGVGLQCLFNPRIGFRATIKLTSEYSPAAWVNNDGQSRSLPGDPSIYPPSNGLWVVQRVQHDLQTEAPGGPWVTTMEAARPEIAGRIAAFGR